MLVLQPHGEYLYLHHNWYTRQSFVCARAYLCVHLCVCVCVCICVCVCACARVCRFVRLPLFECKRIARRGLRDRLWASHPYPHNTVSINSTDNSTLFTLAAEQGNTKNTCCFTAWTTVRAECNKPEAHLSTMSTCTRNTWNGTCFYTNVSHHQYKASITTDRNSVCSNTICCKKICRKMARDNRTSERKLAASLVTLNSKMDY